MISRSTILVIAMILAAFSSASALELKDITYTTTDAGKVVFSHATHLQKKSKKNPNFNCKTCHNSTMGKNVRYTMADMEKGKSCGQCHNGNKAFALAKCTGCHKVQDVAFQVKETGPVIFSHNSHLKKSDQCNTCHNRLYKTGKNPTITMAEMAKGKGCGECHNGKTAFAVAECVKCHRVKDITYKVPDLGSVKFSHTNHIAAYRCEECHTKIYQPSRSKKQVSMAEMEQGKSCGACHDKNTAFSVKGNCDKCH
jgi:c(7)-type cytochrome triheme protein